MLAKSSLSALTVPNERLIFSLNTGFGIENGHGKMGAAEATLRKKRTFN
jgi:hypothetical protein